ncbi:MAG: hypothetical protein QOE31_2635 [Solirubrobacteraceae bacterium]|nr:hypothetical protein [Solirubrobacteraceae bacterium]
MSGAAVAIGIVDAPVRLTIRHVYDFAGDRALVGDDLVRPQAWDALRTQTTGPFALPDDRAAWIANAEADEALGARADAIDRWLRDAGASSVASYGAGTGALEWLLACRAPERRMTATDFGPETVARLAGLFEEATVRTHDLLRDPPLRADVHLLHRVDTELTDDEFRAVLRAFERERVLVVATGVLAIADVALMALQRVRRRHLTRAGWARSRGAFEALWRPTHDATALTVHDLAAWDLRPRR